MKNIKLFCVGLLVLITGCAKQTTPYHVVESLVYKKGYMNGFYKQGVTEEVISPANQYKLTVKLDSYSSKKRAQSMLLFHAAKLTITSGAERFYITKNRTSTSCRFITNRENSANLVKDSGPTSHGFITIMQPETASPQAKRKYFTANEVLENHKSLVMQGESPELMKHNRKENDSHCSKRL